MIVSLASELKVLTRLEASFTQNSDCRTCVRACFEILDDDCDGRLSVDEAWAGARSAVATDESGVSLRQIAVSRRANVERIGGRTGAWAKQFSTALSLSSSACASCAAD